MNRIQKITCVAVGIFFVMTLCYAIYFFVFSLPPESGNMWGNVSDSNSARIIQLQEQVKNADELALRGSQQIADEEYLKGASNYFRSLISLPHAPITRPRKTAYQKQFKRAFRRIFYNN